MKNTTETQNWTEKQWAAYRMLKAATERYEAQVAKARSIVENAPKGGWTDADKVAK